jgi:hypothetical protein
MRNLRLLLALTAPIHVACGGDDGTSSSEAVSSASGAGGNASSSSSSGEGGGGPSLHAIGGTVLGLSGGQLVLQNNGGDDRVIEQDGAFSFTTPLADGAAYDVAVSAQPDRPLQHCLVHRGAGNVAGSAVDDIAVVCVGAVAPLYPSSGANWNDYVARDGLTRIDAGDAPCDPATASGYGACLHGGEMRAIDVPGKADCVDVSASDELEAFRWHCDDSGASVRVVATGLADDAYLSHLLDFTTSAWRPNRVTIRDTDGVYAESPATAWWTNPVAIDNDGGSLTEAGTIYLVTSGAGPSYGLAADRQALVVDPSVVRRGPGAGDALISASGLDFVWLEGAINAVDDTLGLAANSLEHSVIRGLRVKNALGPGIQTSEVNDSLVMDVTVSNAGQQGFRHISGERSVLRRIHSDNVGDYGFRMDDGSNIVVAQLTTMGSAQFGVVISGDSNALLGVTTLNNANAGSLLDDRITVFNIAAVNDDQGVILTPDGVDQSLVNVALAGDGIDLQVGSADNYFGGYFAVEATCFLNGTPTNPGIDSSCNPLAPSDFELHRFVSMAATLVGKVGTGALVDATDDDVNPEDDATPGTTSLASLAEWFGFENRYRAWGRDGSALPNDDHRGRCLLGQDATCRIWDVSLAIADAGDPNGGGAGIPGPVALGVVVVPSATDLFEHRVGGTAEDQEDCDALFPGSTFVGDDDCRVTMLRNSHELLGDAFGNDNLLCEWGETCVHMPNIGSYQGHGPLVWLTTVSDGGGQQIELLHHEYNGYP